MGNRSIGKIKVLCAFGTRPEAVKMAPVVRLLKDTERFDARLLVTAQHRRMLDEALEGFNLRPDYDLDVMRDGQTLSDIMNRVLPGMERVFEEFTPDIKLVHGDTSTTLSAALAAYYRHIKVGHVEAGLRTYDKEQPFPEEINRRLVAPIADMNFAPTGRAKENLLSERISGDTIFVTGNTAIDVIKGTVSKDHVFRDKELNNIDYGKRKVIFLTAHRRENAGAAFESIFGAVRRLVSERGDVEVVYPVHLNPLVRDAAVKGLGGVERVHLVDPVNFTDAHNMIAKCFLVLTDSGGLQEEAPFLNKPVLVLRNVTERPEGIEAGCVKLAGTNGDGVYSAAMELICDEKAYAAMASSPNPFGDGDASRRIADAVMYKFGALDNRPEDFVPPQY